MDEFYMKRALRLARRGEAWVSPNPMVGAVIVKKDRIIGEGYHQKFGGNHAEINAINHVTEPIKGATIYINLEPCTHYGKTPPCIESILAAKPARVVIGTPDANPIVTGKGIEALKRHGIKTTVGILEESCKELNERFFIFMRNPQVRPEHRWKNCHCLGTFTVDQLRAVTQVCSRIEKSS
jgi:diaminohydroxyphosphoribosylaminopyrimidine deaminase/5-amino-6-(5-phosphoribosylamino)uracil reductase